MRLGITNIKDFSNYEIVMYVFGEWELLDTRTKKRVPCKYSNTGGYTYYELEQDNSGEVVHVRGCDLYQHILPFLRDSANYSSDRFTYPEVDLAGEVLCKYTPVNGSRLSHNKHKWITVSERNTLARRDSEDKLKLINTKLQANNRR